MEEQPLPYNPNNVQESHPVIQHALKYGLMLAAALIITELLFIVTSMGASALLPVLCSVILIGFITWAAFDYRKKVWNGYISYGKVFVFCLLTIVCGAVIRGLFGMIEFQWIAPDLPEEMYQKWVENMQSASSFFGEEATENMITQGKASFTPLALAFGKFLNPVIWTGLVSLIIAAIVKKNRPPFPQS